MFPSFNEIIAVLVTAIVLTTASGHGDLVWKGIAQLRQVSMTQRIRKLKHKSAQKISHLAA